VKLNLCGSSSSCSSLYGLIDSSVCISWNRLFVASLGKNTSALWSYLNPSSPRLGAQLVVTGGIDYYHGCPNFEASSVILLTCQNPPGDDSITFAQSSNCQFQFIINSKQVCKLNTEQILKQKEL